jgi:hypothetical protein
MELEVIIGAVLTACILLYLIGDNPAFRLAIHILVGVGAAYALGVAISQVLYPDVVLRIASDQVGEQALGLFGLLGLVLLLAKVRPRAAWLGNAAVGYMLGAGVGVAVGGALLGTLVPQTLDSALSLNQPTLGGFVINALILISTLATLLAFAYRRAARRSFIQVVALVGRGFLYVAFGATFALVFISGASVLSAWLRDIFVRLSGG